MARFRGIKTLQKFASAHAAVYNHVNLNRHLNCRDASKHNRAAALAEWYYLDAQKPRPVRPVIIRMI
jgi:putative transposase